MQIIFLVAKSSKIILPDTYYLDYFNFVLEHVQTHYLKILQEREEKFILQFKELSFESQCLFVRMANRKGDYFRPSKLVYREIKNVSLCLEELHRSEFISYDDFEDTFKLLNLFTKPEIIEIGKTVTWEDYYQKSNSKADITILIYENESDENIIKNLSTYDQIVSMKKVEELDFIKLLFFGNHYGDMSQFVIKDIGNAKFEDFDNEKFTPHFHTREEADSYVYVAQQYREFKLLRTEYEPIELFDWFQNKEFGEPRKYPKPKKYYERFTNKFAYELEQSGYLEEALSLYQTTTLQPSYERQLRILRKLDREEEVIELAKYIIENSRNPKEQIFASDFLSNTSAKRITKSTTKRLKIGDSIEIVQDTRLKVEDQAIMHFQEMGYEAFHTENFLWRSIFGLLFWEEIFDESMSAIHHPLQRAPSDIHDPKFYEKRESLIKSKLKTLSSKKKTIELIESNYQEKHGIANPFVYWFEGMLDLVIKTIGFISLKALKTIVHQIALNTKDNSTGFPDLLVYKGREYHFYEVKSPNDHLSEQQLFWLELMESNGIKVDILKIKWKNEA